MSSIRSIFPSAIAFVELPPLEFSVAEFPRISSTELPRAVNATHWYDGVTLFLRSWKSYFTVDVASKKPIFGQKSVRSAHTKQLASIKKLSKTHMDDAPTLIGECGIPYNLNGARAFRDGNFQDQACAMHNTIAALESNLLSYTLWCYTSDNTNELGDLWNLEVKMYTGINNVYDYSKILACIS